MKIKQVTVEVLETPVDLQYIAAGHSVQSNWHVLSRVNTADGIQGIGFAVATRAPLVRALAHTAEELGQALVGMRVTEIEAARAKMEGLGGWAGPGGMLSMAMATLDIALWDAPGKIVGAAPLPVAGGPLGSGAGLRQRRSLVQLAIGCADQVGPTPCQPGLPPDKTPAGPRGEARG